MRLICIMIVMFLLSSCTAIKKTQEPTLTVERLDHLDNVINNSTALIKTIDDVEQIKTLINLIENLPEFPEGIVHCPFDNGVNYDLKFNGIFNGNVVNVEATGCQQVKLNNKVYWGLEPKGKGFRPYLIKTLGLNDEEFSVVMK